ncbi:hypothetical protein T552_00914 [Pneumocystis carinii B80]|uniref:Phosducin thioredoxin-like domain-containing protein n=1 Tax=Pneumocystis carinii (strain B80) TaxID=1408658 RepID=A0A0W4ZMX0_PNEC8|nr:hypothetical protein T552_00914 [Pneumocystis carinii B80]KTW29707.1 hypothetical protein T552_00914 [Pneumocystis carinii B80]
MTLDSLENLENSYEIVDDKTTLDPTEISSFSRPRRLHKISINTGPKGVIHDANSSRMLKITNEIEEKKEILFKQLSIKSRINIGDHRLNNKDDLFEKSNPRNIEELDCTSLLEVIENCKKVLILIHDESEESKIIEDCFSEIATRYTSIEFRKIFHEKVEMDSVGVPAILGYQDGELVINMIRVIDEICPGKNVVADDLEEILIRNSSFFA